MAKIKKASPEENKQSNKILSIILLSVFILFGGASIYSLNKDGNVKVDRKPAVVKVKLDLKKLRDATVKIGINSAVEKGGAYGTGVVIHSNSQGSWILTAKHVCVVGQFPTEVFHEYPHYMPAFVFYKKERTIGYINAIDQNSDLCLINVPSLRNIDSVPVSNTPPKRNDKVYMISWRSIQFNFIKDIVSGPVVSGEHAYFMLVTKIDAKNKHGNSGGGVFNEAGEVIGTIFIGWQKNAKDVEMSQSGITTFRDMRKFIKRELGI